MMTTKYADFLCQTAWRMYDWNGLSGGTLPGRNAEGNEACGLARAVMRPNDEASTNGT